MITEEYWRNDYWRNVLCGCFLSLGMFIAFMKMCVERYTLHLYRTSLMKTLCIITFPNLLNRHRGLLLTYLRPISTLYRNEPIRLECKLIGFYEKRPLLLNGLNENNLSDAPYQIFFLKWKALHFTKNKLL